MRPTAIDLFAGAGGMSLGFEQAGFDVVAAVELDPIHCATHEYNFPHCATICKSVAATSAAEIRTAAGLEKQPVHVVFGGAPCQGFSLIGKRVLDDPRNSLVREFVRIVAELKAWYFVFENVKGLTIGKHQKFLHELMASFDDVGYDVEVRYRVLNAAHFGVPQERHRLFLMGVLRRPGIRLPVYPRPTTTSRTAMRPITECVVGPTVWDAIGDLPDVDQIDELLSKDATHCILGEPSVYAAAMRAIAPDTQDFSHPRTWDPSMLTSSMRTIHTALSKRRFRATKPGCVEPVSRFHKLDPDGLCNTLRAGTASDRGAFTSPRPIHPFAARVITVREAARLHSYPDWFRFHVTKWHGFRQVGNSVPPRLARSVAAQILQAVGLSAQRPKIPLALGSPGLLAMNMAEAASRYGVSRTTIPQRTRLAVAPG